MTKLQTALATRLSLVAAGLSTPQLKREEGQTFVEYAMILALIAVVVVGALTFLRGQLESAYTAIANAI
jgi:Flp pilus assembly pilin Flp